MSQVTVRLFAGAAEAFGGRETRLDRADTLGSMIDQLCEHREPRLRDVLDQCSFFVAGERCTSPDTELTPGSVVDVLPPFAGG